MQTPILIIVGEAGSGKDTVAGFLAKNHNYAVIAQADPMKRLVGYLFGFTEDQLWGPSSSRNAEDPRFTFPTVQYVAAHERLRDRWTKAWLAEIGYDTPEAYRRLMQWFMDLEKAMSDGKRTLTPRAALQTLGTEFGRSLDQNVWSRLAINTAEKLLLGGYLYTAQDGLISKPGFKGFDNVVVTDGRFRNEVLNVLKAGGRALRLLNPKDESEATESAGFRGHASEAEQKGIPDEWFLYTMVNDKRRGLGVLEKRVFALANPVIKVTFNDGLDTESTAAGRPPNCT